MILLIFLLMSLLQPNAAIEHTIFFPVISRSCQRPTKAGLAWAWRPLGADQLHQLCLDPNTVTWHGWSPTVRLDPRLSPPIPMLSTPNQLEQFTTIFPPNYAGPILFGNECDRPDQCNATPHETAALLISAIKHCPACQWIGPSYSVLDDGRLSEAFYQEFVSQGGNPERIIAGGLHIYPDGTGLSPRQRINRYYGNYMIPTGQSYKPVWITEIGWRSCFPDNGRSSFWLNQLTNDGRVERYFAYSPYVGPDFGAACPFIGLFDWTTGELTTWGKALAEAS